MTTVQQPPQERRVGVALGAGIFFIPAIFAWFTLRRGYDKAVRFIAFAWAVLLYGYVVWHLPPAPKPAEVAEQAKIDAINGAADEDLAVKAKWRDDNLVVAKMQILKILKDPDSAKFSDMFVVEPKKFDKNAVGTVCGYVNSRNSFGGYVGAQPFFVIAGIADVEGFNNANAFRQVWNRECAHQPQMP